MAQTLGSEYSLEEVAKVLGITKERVRQIEQMAIKKLKHPKVSRELRNYTRNDYGI